MQQVFSIPKQGYCYDSTSLYVFKNNLNKVYIETIDIKTSQNTGSLEVTCSSPIRFYTHVDSDYIYLIDGDSNLLIIDKFDGIINEKYKLNAIPICSPETNSNYIYVFTVLPTKTSNIQFTTFFLQIISKLNGKHTKRQFFQGNPNKKLLLNNSVFYSSSNRLFCCDLQGNFKWESILKGNMLSPPLMNKEYIFNYSLDGLVQVNDHNGKIVLNIQLEKTECEPCLEENFIWFYDKFSYHINIEKAIHREKNWQIKKEESTTPITCGLMKNKELFLVSENQITYKKQKLQTKQPVLRMKSLSKNKILGDCGSELVIIEHD